MRSRYSFSDETPILIAKLFDENGINTVGNGIGHDVTAAAFSNPMGSLTLTVTDNVADSGPFYYGLTNDVVSNFFKHFSKASIPWAIASLYS